MHSKKEKTEAFARLLDIMDDLREKCPWDKEQTFDSLHKLTIEETYELADAIVNRDMDEIKKELGDVLLHIVFYAKMGSEENAFDILDVINSLCDKLIYRHPHIYSNASINNSKQVLENWEQLKLKEKGRKQKTLLGGLPKGPAMVKANRMQEKVSAVGFDWDSPEQVWEKVKEEISELEQELKDDNKDKIEAEFGDVFFSMINAARLYGIDPEIALARTNQKFNKRFNYLEQETILKGKDLRNMSLPEMDKYWNEAKQLEKDNKL